MSIRKDAAIELLRRRQIRRSLVSFAKHNGFEPAKHHLLLISKLEAVARGEIKRLMIFMPPGSAKSTYSTILFPPYFLANNKTKNVLCASHTTELAERFGRRVRNIIADNGALLNMYLSDDNKAAGRWSTTDGSEYFAAGVGVGIAGFRADLGVIDDPIRSRQDADSELIRNRQWDWYVSDFTTRLKPNAAVVLIQTRWHEDDLAGRLLLHEPDKWQVISLAMEALPNDPLGRQLGDPLWEEWFTDEMRETAKRDSRLWNALYQQQPAPDDGDYFKLEMFNTYDELPADLIYYGASDYAVTDGDGDFTEHGIFATDANGNLYVIDWWKGQTNADVWIDKKLDLCKRYKPVRWFSEGGVIRRSIEPFLRKRMTERKIYQSIDWLSSISDKTTRARSIQGRFSMGMVYFPMNNSWVNDLKKQLLSFPAGKYDDGVDVFSLIGRGLDTLQNAQIPSKRKPAPATGSIEWLLSRTDKPKEVSKFRS